MTNPDIVVRRFSLRASEREQPRLARLLAADERIRAGRFVRIADRWRFVVARARLRLTLADWTEASAAELRFAYGPHGKPSLVGHPTLRFSLAHAGDEALVVVTQGREVGVDLEPLHRGRDLVEAARVFFSSAECAALAALTPARRPAAIVRCWCRKEAYLKARGEGLTMSLASFDVAVDVANTGQSLLLATRPNGSDACAWHVQDLDVGALYAAAIAVARPPVYAPS